MTNQVHRIPVYLVFFAKQESTTYFRHCQDRKRMSPFHHPLSRSSPSSLSVGIKEVFMLFFYDFRRLMINFLVRLVFY